MKRNFKEFIKEHKHINYCEAIVHPTGEVEYAQPSHVECLIRIYNKPKNIINAEMPLSTSPIIWLSEKTQCIPVYTNGYYLSPNLASSLTLVQMEALVALINAKLVKNYNMY
jgi:hypothetical protein